MFTKKNLVDIKKSTVKLQDSKKDLATRIKHLKLILENVDLPEAKGLFEANFSHVYNILYESFYQMEVILKQRELSFHLVHKAHKEEIDCTLWILEQILCLLPELINRRWQTHSLSRMLAKLLHSGNSMKLRRQGMKFFLMWYQALNENAPEYVHKMFGCLVPGFNEMIPTLSQITGSVFHDDLPSVSAPDIIPIFSPSNNEKLPDHPSKYCLESLLDDMAHTVVKLEWHDKSSHYHKCFSFLMEQFKVFYLAKLFPNFNSDASLYKPNFELPSLRKMENETEFVFCRVSLIVWITSYVHPGKKSGECPNDVNQQNYVQQTSEPQVHDEEPVDSAPQSFDSNISTHTTKTATDEELVHQIVRDVLYSSRDNVNFLHELFKHAFLLNINHVTAIRKVILIYKDLIQENLTELPPYALEPCEDGSRVLERECRNDGIFEKFGDDPVSNIFSMENISVRAGLQNIYQMFIAHAANVFLLEINPHIPRLLEEQTDTCKRVLNIYRYMVMNVKMDNNTWQELLLVLLQVTSLVLGKTPPKNKLLTLGGKLAPAIFQTLIVTWIKANLNVAVSKELWDRFLDVLISLTVWEELIKEWAKTMETLTRVLARHVYGLDLTNLPLDRINEQKSKKNRRTTARSGNISNISGAPNEGLHQPIPRQNFSLHDANVFLLKGCKMGLSKSYSENNLDAVIRSYRNNTYAIHRRSKSLELLPSPEVESTDHTRSPSPAPSSGIESSSIKDSPLQLDVLNDMQIIEANGENRGIVCGGTVRGWLPDVAVILWKRMLCALGNVNQLIDPKLHAQVFEYLIKLTEALFKIKQNLGITVDNIGLPQTPDLVPPVTLILPWCFGALCLPETFEAGKLNALRLLISIMLHSDSKQQDYLPQFYTFVHTALTASTKACKNISLKYLGPRFLSLHLPGSSLILLDIVHACNDILNTTEKFQLSSKLEVVSILSNLLSFPDDLSYMSVLQPESNIVVINNCPDIKEHVVSILLRAGRRENLDKARSIALCGLGIFVYKELTNNGFSTKIAEALHVLLLALKVTNKTIVQLTSDILLLLCDYGTLLWTQYPHLCKGIISELCAALKKLIPVGSLTTESDRGLGMALLLCLGEWCMQIGPERLQEPCEFDNNQRGCLMLQVFTVLHQLIKGSGIRFKETVSTDLSSTKGFDSKIFADDVHCNKTLFNDRSATKGLKTKNVQHQKAVSLCAESVLAHLINYLGHFPMSIGAVRLSSIVAEHDDVPDVVSDDLSSAIFLVPCIQLFILTRSCIASLIDLPALDSLEGGSFLGLATANRQARILLRNISGKASWDASILYKTYENIQQSDLEITHFQLTHFKFQNKESESLVGTTLIPQNLSQRAMRHRQPDVLPQISDAALDLDQLDDLLQYLGYTSPECLEFPKDTLNNPPDSAMSIELEQEVLASIVSQRNTEFEEAKVIHNSVLMMGQPIIKPNVKPFTENNFFLNTVNKQDIFGETEENTFQQCRLFFSQLGFLGWDYRKQMYLLEKSDRLLRELRNLDNQSCRETHKFAVIYVASGQEDKNSILSNQCGSAAYEQFLSALAWEIELEYHTGFLGGLQKQGSTGITAPYVATSFIEAIFHVATRMPGDSAEAVLNKTRHLGNDEVHIVWSEHNRDYRRDIIPTEFCDILIVIYPLGNKLNRVTVNCKADVPHFGVLFHEAIVESNILAGLIRTTVICASRAKRMTYEFYQQYYEERFRSLEVVVEKYKYATTFEQLLFKVYNPLSTFGLFNTSGSVNTLYLDEPPSMLTDTLLDSHEHFHDEHLDQKYKDLIEEQAKNIWPTYIEMQNMESSLSPRSSKIAPTLRSSKKSVKDDSSLDSPPETPEQINRKDRARLDNM